MFSEVVAMLSISFIILSEFATSSLVIFDIWSISSPIFLTDSNISTKVTSVSLDTLTPFSTASLLTSIDLTALFISISISFIKDAIFPDSILVCSDNFLTSSATTAKPLPCSPARAASMLALSASKFVSSEILSIVSIIPLTLSETSLNDFNITSVSDETSLMFSIASTASFIFSLPSDATSIVSLELSLAIPALLWAIWIRLDNWTKTSDISTIELSWSLVILATFCILSDISSVDAVASSIEAASSSDELLRLFASSTTIETKLACLETMLLNPLLKLSISSPVLISE